MRTLACLTATCLTLLPHIAFASANTEITGGYGINSRVQERVITERIVRPGRPAGPVEELPENTKRIVLMYGDVKRSYLLHVPRVLKLPFCPLVIAFHSEGSKATVMEQLTGFSDVADRYGFIVAYPEATAPAARWNTSANEAGQADRKLVEDIIAGVSAQFAILPSAIFATGISNGAQMAGRLSCVMPDIFAAVGLVAGNYPIWQDCLPRPLSAILFHGTADQITPYKGQALQMGSAGFAQRLALQNKCPSASSEVFRKDDAHADGWGNCAARTEIVNFTFEGKGHSWPGSAMPEEITSKTVDATSAIWNFFFDHQQRPYNMPVTIRPPVSDE